jgi:hypothetical protein
MSGSVSSSMTFVFADGVICGAWAATMGATARQRIKAKPRKQDAEELLEVIGGLLSGCSEPSPSPE